MVAARTLARIAARIASARRGQAVARSAKRIHYLMIMVNESTGQMPAHFECVNALVDLQARNTTAYPAEILTRIDALLVEQSQLPWPPPISGAMRV